MNILFVCSANISRSFLADMLLKNEIELSNLEDISVSSAGLFAYSGVPPDSEMVSYLSKMGIPVKNHESRKMTEDDVDWADLILVMERAHAETIKESWPKAGAKVELLGSLLSPVGHADDVIDPFRRTPYHYRLAQSQITLAVKALVDRFTK